MNIIVIITYLANFLSNWWRLFRQKLLQILLVIRK